MKHWKAQTELVSPQEPRRSRPRALERWARVDSFEPAKAPRRQSELPGALVGLVLVASACAGLCLMLYQVTGPRDTFVEGDGPID